MYLLDDDGLWKRKGLAWLLEYFQENEQYEKCNFIKKFIESDDYIADKEKQNELNAMLYKKIK